MRRHAQKTKMYEQLEHTRIASTETYDGETLASTLPVRDRVFNARLLRAVETFYGPCIGCLYPDLALQLVKEKRMSVTILHEGPNKGKEVEGGSLTPRSMGLQMLARALPDPGCFHEVGWVDGEREPWRLSSASYPESSTASSSMSESTNACSVAPPEHAFVDQSLFL